MADETSDLMKDFEAFLAARKENEDAEKAAEDFEVEIWDEKGRGVRTRRSHAKPFLQSLGIDTDEPSSSDEGNSGDNDAGKDKSKGSGQRKNPPTGSTSTVRKYFTKNPVKLNGRATANTG